MKHLRYLKKLMTHKWFVYKAGRLLDVPLWRLIIHDWTKFLPVEWTAYADRFGTGRAGKFDDDSDPGAFHYAWTHHWHRNPHHWEYWLGLNKDRMPKPMEMPDTYIREMVADWVGAGRGYTGKWDIAQWYAAHTSQINVTSSVRKRVEQYIDLILPLLD